MASPAQTEFLAELAKQIAVIDPEIRGLQYVANDPLPTDALEIMRRQEETHKRRKSLCEVAIAAIDQLEKDGYPTIHRQEATPEISKALHGWQSDVGAAINGLEPPAQARTMKLSLGPVAQKP